MTNTPAHVSIDTATHEVERLRAGVARTDQEIVSLIARRLELVRALGEEKARCGLPTADPAREAAVLRAVGEAARDTGIDEERVREVFWCIIEMSRTVQLRDRTS